MVVNTHWRGFNATTKAYLGVENRSSSTSQYDAVQRSSFRRALFARAHSQCEASTQPLLVGQRSGPFMDAVNSPKAAKRLRCAPPAVRCSIEAVNKGIEAIERQLDTCKEKFSMQSDGHGRGGGWKMDVQDTWYRMTKLETFVMVRGHRSLTVATRNMQHATYPCRGCILVHCTITLRCWRSSSSCRA